MTKCGLDDMKTDPEMSMEPQDDEERLLADETGDGVADELGSEESAPTAVESEEEMNLETVPDDPDEAIAWLESLAAKQGARLEELPTVESQTATAFQVEEFKDINGLDDVDAGEIPEDPDEAMAWLEMLAAKEVANVDDAETEEPAEDGESVAVSASESEEVEESVTSPLSADLEEALDASLPDDIDQALGWLEELTTPSNDSAEFEESSESPVVIEEVPTPAVAHNVDEALAGAELLFAGSEDQDESNEVESLRAPTPEDDDDEAMAWLEQLAARQGAPLEELTTIDEETDAADLEELLLSEIVQAGEESTELPVAEFQSLDEPNDSGSVTPEPEIQIEIETAATDQLLESTELDQELLSPSIEAEVITISEMVEPEASELPMQTHEPGELAFDEQDELEVAADDDVPSGDLAWLDTLGAVDAEGWLEAEEAVDADNAEPVSQLVESGDELFPEQTAPQVSEEPTLVNITPDGPGAEALVEARQAMEQGEVVESLTKYAVLVEQGENLSFVINDLELLREQREPELVLQRLLGDAYARNGQLRKAIESYREALANL
jgi:hypothetical protein